MSYPMCYVEHILSGFDPQRGLSIGFGSGVEDSQLAVSLYPSMGRPSNDAKKQYGSARFDMMVLVQILVDLFDDRGQRRNKSDIGEMVYVPNEFLQENLNFFVRRQPDASGWLDPVEMIRLIDVGLCSLYPPDETGLEYELFGRYSILYPN